MPSKTKRELVSDTEPWFKQRVKELALPFLSSLDTAAPFNRPVCVRGW